MSNSQQPEVTRLENLWSGEFGDQYGVRNSNAAEGRAAFWGELLAEFPVSSALEVGCNVGGNLQWVSEAVMPRTVYGVDINEQALEELRTRIPQVNAVWAPARELPFRDRWFELAFTMGVLIHQPPETLPLVMSEIVRCSRKYVLCGEYFAEDLTEVPYRGQTGALWKQDFGATYQRLFPELKLRKKGFLPKGVGSWDDVTYWLFEKGEV